MDSELEFGLASFTNSELLYIISTLMDAGCSVDCSELQKLYISIDEKNDYGAVFSINYILVTSDTVSIGTFDLTGENSTVITYSFDDLSIDLEICDFDITLLEGKEQNFKIPHPYAFVDGMRRIAAISDLHIRKKNDTFRIYPETPIPANLFHRFNFSNIRTLGDKDFSGTYFLIAQPAWDVDGLKMSVNCFEITDNNDDFSTNRYIIDKVDICKAWVTPESLDNYKNGKSNSIENSSRYNFLH